MSASYLACMFSTRCSDVLSCSSHLTDMLAYLVSQLQAHWLNLYRLTMVWTVQDIKNDIEATSVLLKVRWQAVADAPANDAASLSYTKLEDGMTRNICSKVSALSCLDACGNMCLFTALSNSTLPDSVKSTIQTAIDDKMSLVAESAVHEPVDTTKTQKLITPWNYLTQGDWDVIYDAGTPYFKKVLVITSRFRKLGISHLHEQTVKWAMATIVAVMSDQAGALPKYKVLYTMIQDFKTSFTSTPANSLAGIWIRVFPDTPDKLPKELYDFAYTDAPPVAKVVDRVSQVANFHLPLRSTSKLLRDEKSTEDTRITQVGPPSMTPMEWVQTIQQLAGQHLHARPPSSDTRPALDCPALSPLKDPGYGFNLALTDGPSSSDSLPHGSEFKPKPRVAQPDVPAVPPVVTAEASGVSTEQPSSPVVHVPGKGPPVGLTADHFEDAAFAALMSGAKHKLRKGKGKGKGEAKADKSPKADATPKPKAGSKGGATKKPQAGTTTKPVAVVKKRPSAAPSFPPELVPVWPSNPEATTKVKFGSKHYHKAKAFARRTGLADEHQSELAREAYGMAVSLWLKHNS